MELLIVMVVVNNISVYHHSLYYYYFRDYPKIANPSCLVVYTISLNNGIYLLIEKDSPHPQVVVAFGLEIINFEPVKSSM